MQINVPYNPPITLPVAGSGGCVVDVRGMVIATCPNSQVADALANIINDYANDRGLMLPPTSAPPHCDWLYGFDRAASPQEGNDQ
jgi:hypothetical protein